MNCTEDNKVDIIKLIEKADKYSLLNRLFFKCSLLVSIIIEPIMTVLMLTIVIGAIMHWYPGKSDVLEGKLANNAVNNVVDAPIQQSNDEPEVNIYTIKAGTLPSKNIEDMYNYISTNFKLSNKKIIKTISIETNNQCLKHDISFPLIVGMMEVESSYNTNAKSKKDAHGLMGIKYDVWAQKFKLKNRHDLYSVKTNVNIGISILKEYIDKNDGDIVKSLQNYNGSNDNEFPDLVFKAVGRFTVHRSMNSNKSIKSTKDAKKVSKKHSAKNKDNLHTKR